MKSLKRTLCLVLALVMVLGLFGVASATNFTDDNTIQYKEAVEVVTGIGAIKGMGDGTFAPKGTITRAQAATMVARVALTNKIADDLKGVTSSFTDVTEAGGFGWAIPSIEYLVSNNIINGMGDGTFNPNGEISGYAVLKMLLCVLGYGAKDEYVGTGWDLKVAVDANKYGLTTGRVEGTPALSAPATREEVALYCFNALGTEIVTYNALENRYEKGAANSSTYISGKATTLADDVYKVQAVVTGIVKSNGAISAVDAKSGTTTVGSNIYAINTGLDLVGHYVKVYYRPATAAETKAATDAGATTLNGVAFSVVDASTVVNVTAPIDTAAKWTAAFGTGTITNTSGVGTTLVNGSYGVTTGTVAGLNIAGKMANPGTYILVQGDIVSYIAPAAYEAGIVANYKAATATAAGNLTLQGGGAENTSLPATGSDAGKTFYATHKLYDGIQAGDIVIVKTVGNFVTYEKATSVTGTVTNYKETTTPAVTSIVADGTTYVAATGGAAVGAQSNVTTAAGPVSTVAVADGMVNQKYTIYLGPDGKAVAFILASDAPNSRVLMHVTDAWVEGPVTGAFGAQTVTIKVQGVNIETGEKAEYIVDVQRFAEDKYTSLLGADGLVTAASSTQADMDDLTGKFFYAEIKENKDLGIKYADVASAAGTIAALASGDAWGTGKNMRSVSAETNSGINAATKYVFNTSGYASGYDYLNENAKFVYITGTGKDLKVNVLPYPQTLSDSINYTIFTTDIPGSATNSEVNYVVMVDQAVTPVASKDVIFVPNFTEKNLVTYTAPGATEPTKVMQQVGFVNGELNTSIKIANTIKDAAGTDTVTASSLEGKKCFFKYEVGADGLYALQQIADTDANVGAVNELYKGTISATAASGTSITNPISFAGAKFVDVQFVTGQSTTEHTIDSLKHGDVIAWHITTDTSSGVSVKTVDTIYYLEEAGTEAGVSQIQVVAAGTNVTGAAATATYAVPANKVSVTGSTGTIGTSEAPLEVAAGANKNLVENKAPTVTVTASKGATVGAVTVTGTNTATNGADKTLQISFTVTSGDGQTAITYTAYLKYDSVEDQ